MDLVYLIFILLAGVELCKSIPSREIRKRALTRRLKPHSLGIIKGTRVRIRDYPYAADITFQGEQWGTGVVINSSFILTTALNIYNIAPDGFRVRVGSEKWSLGGQFIPVTDIIVHENYTWQSVDYDIALIKLSRPIRFGQKLQPATLGTKPLNPGTQVTVVGWGATQMSSDSSVYPASEFLLGANLTTIKLSECESAVKLKLQTSFCTAPADEIPCDLEDTGAPLVANGEVYGVTSSRICRQGTPAIYTDVTRFLPWIQSHAH